MVKRAVYMDFKKCVIFLPGLVADTGAAYSWRLLLTFFVVGAVTAPAPMG